MAIDRLERRRMSFEEFLALPEDVHAEYLDGMAIVSPPADIPHQALATRIAVLFAHSLPDLVPVAEAGLRTIRDGHRIPDVMLLRAEEQSVWAEQRPVLVVEITSRSTRTEDTLRKPGEYAQAGVGQYWLLDRDQRSLTVIEHLDGVASVILELDDGRPTGRVDVGGHGVVDVDLPALLGPDQM
jgi:Uma2 family endonuclease